MRSRKTEKKDGERESLAQEDSKLCGALVFSLMTYLPLIYEMVKIINRADREGSLSDDGPSDGAWISAH
jgi:hypothetical protein